MQDIEQSWRLLLAALALGVTIPVLVQLFLTLRSVRRVVGLFEGQLESEPESPPPPAKKLPAVLAAMVAGYRAFRQPQPIEESQVSEDRS
jgi:hypothetical protein